MTSSIQKLISELDSLFVTREPRPTMREHPDGILWNFRDFQLVLSPLGQHTYQVVEVVCKTPVAKVRLDRAGVEAGVTVNSADLMRIVIEGSREAKMARQKFEISDKTTKDKGINPKNLKVDSFMPHFGVGPTYYGVIDSSNLSWLAGHEYSTKKEADLVLRDIQSGKISDLSYRGF